MRQTAAFLLCFVFIGSTAFKPTFGDAQPQISGNWLVDIRTVCVVGAVVLGGTWWVAKWMQRVLDRLEALELSATERELVMKDIQLKVHHIASGDIRHSKGKELE
jgi:hypothetical protein